MGKITHLHDRSKPSRTESVQSVQQFPVPGSAERAYLAAELHDTLGQVLGYVNLRAQVARVMLADGRIDQVDLQLRDLIETVQEAQDEVREAIFHLKTAQGPRRSLLTSLMRRLRRLRDIEGIQADLLAPEDLGAAAMDSEVELQLLRVLEEALANVRKHAHATLVRVELRPSPNKLAACVEDNGKGFDPESVPGEEAKRFGLRLMRERAEAVGGQLAVSSRPGSGTRIMVEVPLRLAS